MDIREWLNETYTMLESPGLVRHFRNASDFGARIGMKNVMQGASHAAADAANAGAEALRAKRLADVARVRKIRGFAPNKLRYG